MYQCIKKNEMCQAFQPFNARAGHYDGRYFFVHNLPAARARELFKPCTDLASLLVSIENDLC